MTVIEKSSGNVFADLGFPDPETHALKAALVRRISTLIEREKLTQADAAKRMGISQPDVSKMLKGQFRPFSLERLMRFLNALGQDVEISVKAPSRRRARGKLTVHAI
jgi:predicted XRE-type DNA-binding protein